MSRKFVVAAAQMGPIARDEPRASAVVVCPYWTGAPWFEPLAKLASSSIVLPAGSLRAVASRTGHVKSWRAVAFHVTKRL